MRYILLPLAALLVSVFTSCTPESRVEPASPPAKQAATPPPEAPTASPLDQARALLASGPESDAEAQDLLDAAKGLERWAKGKGPKDALSAAIVGGKLQLVAVVIAKTKADLETSSQTLLRRIATHPQLANATDEEALQVKEAALAILGLDTDVKDVRINRGAALELAASPGLAGQAVRAAWLNRATRALDAWATLPSELSAGVAVPLSGRMLCPRCADAHHITPDKVVPLLLGEGNAGGLICDQAIAAGRNASEPSDYVGALSLCETLWPTNNPADPALFWGLNTPVISLLRTAATLTEAPIAKSLMTPITKARLEALQAQLARPWVLPTAVIAAPKRAEGKRDPLVFIPNLGGAGLSTQYPPLSVFSIGPDGLRVGLRPTLAYEAGALISLSVQAGLPAGGRQVLSLEALRAAPRDSKGGIAEISSATNEVTQAASSIRSALDRKDPSAGGVTLALDAMSTSSDVSRVLSALHAAGVEVVHVLKSASHGHTLPLMIRKEAAGTRTVLETEDVIAYERPMIAVVTRSHVDLWAPDKPKGELPDGTWKARPPVGTTLGYKGKSLKRIRVPIADPESGLTATGLDLFNRAAGYFLGRDKGAPILHVIGTEGSRAADVLLVARRFQERDGERLENPHVFWPGTRCGGELYKANRRTPNNCATAVSVLFSSLQAPSGRGLSSRPAGSKLSNASDKEPDAPAPSGDAFCDKKDIRVAMNRAKGSFRFCYQRELQSTPDLAGRVVLRFTIGTDGRPKGPAIASSTLKNKAAHACLLKTVKRMTFKPPKGGVCPVRWPFTFQPR